MTVKQKMNGTIKHRRGNEEHKGKYLLRKIIRNRQIYLMLVPVDVYKRQEKWSLCYED